VVLAVLAGGCGDDDPDAVSFVQLPDSRLIKVQSVGLAAFGRINPHTADAELTAEAFGDPTAAAPAGELCRMRWPELGLRIDFAAAEPGGDPCGAGAGIARLVVAGRAAANAHWRTAEGIRPLQPIAAVRRIYPEAGDLGAGRHVLVEPPEGTPDVTPVLVVTIADGRVEAMEFPIETASG
jgi:hypothetical protein